MAAVARQCHGRRRQGGRDSFAFPGLHLDHTPLRKPQCSQHLNRVVSHPQSLAGGFNNQWETPSSQLAGRHAGLRGPAERKKVLAKLPRSTSFEPLSGLENSGRFCVSTVHVADASKLGHATGC